MMGHRVAWAALGILGPVLLAGCETPAGRAQIAYRQQRLAEQWHDRARTEDSKPRKLQEASESVQRWHQMDVDRFEERLPTVGRYFF